MKNKKKNYYDECGAYPLCMQDNCDCLTLYNLKNLTKSKKFKKMIKKRDKK